MTKIIEHLHTAASLEHSLMLHYLYAAYSLDGSADAESARWRSLILSIACEEMGHLITVQNVLCFVGMRPNLGRPQVQFEPLTFESLTRYIRAESRDDEVSCLYRKIISELERIPDTMLNHNSLPYQASSDEWGHGYTTHSHIMIETVATRTQAIDVLQRIIMEGDDLTPNSHFGRFNSIMHDFRDRRIEDVHWQPATYPTTERHRLWEAMFNLRYQMMLSYIIHTFELARDHAKPLLRGAVIHKAIDEMYNIKSIAGILLRHHSAPTFQLHTAKPSWALHLKRLQRAIDLNSKIKDANHCNFLSALQQLDEQSAEWVSGRIAQP